MKYTPSRPSSSSHESQVYNPFVTTSTSSANDEPPHHEPLKKARSIVSTKSLSALFTRTRSQRSSVTRKRRSVTLTTNVHASYSSSTSLVNYKLPDQEEFSFSSDYAPGSDVSSELESLPDLTDDEYTPDSTPIKQVPNSYFSTILEPPPVFELQKLQQLAIHEQRQPAFASSSPSIFEIPEIVHKIISYVDGQNTVLPLECTPVRRRPLSYKHALLIHGNKEMAQNALNEEEPQEVCSPSTSPLFNCLLVNKLFYRITSEIMSQKFYAHEEHQLHKFINNQGPTSIQLQPKVFILHKLFQTKQAVFDQLAKLMNFQSLSWFELYMCPKILPPISIFRQCGAKLKKLIITGSKTVDDEFLNQVSKYCPNLEVIDLRACELVSDFGLYQLSTNCANLRMVNLGRKNRGHFITDTSISRIIDNNRNLNTIGLAGCYISDKVLWELAYKLPNLSRLSLNNCPHISNNCISLIFSNPRFFTKLSVLELRFNLQLSDLKSLIEFKRRQSYHYNIVLLLELCETLMFKLRQQELEMDKLISQKIFQDISDWANDYDDGDLLYLEIIRLARKD
ncbi:Antagonist of mitotic exit network protein 1 [Candida viswanathii]|uniref:Antagonist of mitotic exit network protein 1 n=1 Tax=Candida viswanathii TaxID=5486 RepID=A0A367YLI2_9ASCO|nr:Antagonist of mitotic exit network protein 1 [Candida viswanathii]